MPNNLMGEGLDINGYMKVRVNGYLVLEHRYIWEKYKGKILKGCFIHHINGNNKDNRIENLICVTRKEHGKIHREMRLKAKQEKSKD